MKKQVYRVGDIVRIKTPEFVTRVGYPWNKEYVKKNVITDEQREIIEKLINTVGVTRTNSYGSSAITYFDTVYDKFADELAYWILRAENFGGSERTLHTKIKEQHRDKLAEVRVKRVVKTGAYQGGYSTQGYYDYYPEYEPPCLANEKTHVLLTVEVFSDEDKWAFISDMDNLEIDECNVEIHERKSRWTAHLYPNNQPTIDLGIFTATNREDALNQVCNRHGLDKDDDNLELKKIS